MSPVFDVVVVGAGPYGLSTAAHLLGRGLRVAVFGRTLEMWRDHMPKGMLLRSHWWATNLSDPRKDYGFERFVRESKHEKGYPLPIETFIDYGLWFQQRAVPDVDETYVASIERQGARFLITLEDGREVQSQAVGMAIGLYHGAIGSLSPLEGQTWTKLEVAKRKVAVTLSDGAKQSADHIHLATRYAVDINKLTMIQTSLRPEIETDRAIPRLSHWFETSVPE